MEMSKFGSQSLNRTKMSEQLMEIREKKDESNAGEYVGARLSDGTRDGFGRECFPNGDQYEGEYRRGLRNGKGCYWYRCGAFYSGEWCKGYKSGRGKFSYLDGSEYCGEWKRNKRHGFGKYIYQNGDVYEGHWKENNRHGLGTYAFRDKSVSFKGAWINDLLKGPIVIFYPNFEYHGYFNGSHAVGEGTFTFGMKYMLSGHVEFFPDLEALNEHSRMSNNLNSSKSVGLQQESTAETAVKCSPRFIAHELMPYNYSDLPQQPMPLPESDSSLSTCTSSSSYENVALYQVQSPILISADPFQCGEDDEEE